MTHSTTERIDFGNQVLPANWSLAMERHLEEGWRRGAQTVSQCQRVSPLFKIFQAIRRSARIGFRERSPESEKGRHKESEGSLWAATVIELAFTLVHRRGRSPSFLDLCEHDQRFWRRGRSIRLTISGFTILYTYENVGLRSWVHLPGQQQRRARFSLRQAQKHSLSEP